jgi:perosamine synthetase
MAFPFRYLAPAGSPLAAGDLARWCGTAFSPTTASVALTEALRARFGVRHVFLTSTGRAGMTILLRALRRLGAPERTEVVLPSYTCYSVAASIVKAQLRPRLVDISPDTLDYSAAALAETDFSRVLAVVATNLYGLPNDMPALERLARRHGVFLVDDAAQAMGAGFEGRWSGTWGDAGLFSFDKGKNISAIDGGVIVTNSDQVAAALREEVGDLESPRAATSVLHILKAVAYSVLLRPSLYGIPAHIPQLGLGRTIFTTDFPLSGPDRVLTALALTMVSRLDEFTAARRANAAALRRGLQNVGVTCIEPHARSAPAYLRFPLLVASEREQTAAIHALNAVGIGATRSYPASIADVAGLGGVLANEGLLAAGGRDVARRLVTLPTHPFVGAADIRRMCEVLGGRESGRSPVRTVSA